MRPWLAVLLALGLTGSVSAAERSQVIALKITVLSTMLADGDELGEWGFAALIEADGRTVLFDTGDHYDVVLRNAQSLKLDLSTVSDVVLSHWHSDHVGGFMALRRAAMEKNRAALGRTHVGEGFFASRVGTPPGVELNRMILTRPEYEAAGGTFVVHAKPFELLPGVWLTGPVPRRHPERNWSGNARVKTAAGEREDNIADDMALIADTPQGLVVVTGCGHSGVVNIVEHARTFVRPARVHALIGGIHLFRAGEETLAWTAGKLREFGVEHFIGAHCTGVETVYRFRHDLGLDRAHAVVGAVGQTFQLGKGIDPRAIAR
ncbi:MAG: MBL fold metallo-hydrolase [Opitutaceae bacterium]